jgi:hypothetical protein
MNIEGPRGLLGAVALLAMAGFAVYQKLKTSEVGEWPTVQAVITESRIDSTRVYEDATLFNSPLTVILGEGEESRKVWLHRYELDLVYHYEVAGQHFTGTRTDLDRRNRRRSTVQKQQMKYPVGATVAVHYNPANPAEAMLLE